MRHRSSIRCPDCLTVIKFSGGECREECDMFEKCCTGQNISTLILDGERKVCPECGIKVRFKVSKVIMAEGVKVEGEKL